MAALECSSPGPADPGSEDVTPHCSSYRRRAVPSRHVPKQASRSSPAAGARGQWDLQVSAGEFRAEPSNGRSGGQKGRGRRRGRESGSRAAFWVKPLSGAAAWEAAGRPAALGLGSAVRHCPSGVLGWRAGWAEIIPGLLGNGICVFSLERLQHFYSSTNLYLHSSYLLKDLPPPCQRVPDAGRCGSGRWYASPALVLAAGELQRLSRHC